MMFVGMVPSRVWRGTQVLGGSEGRLNMKGSTSELGRLQLWMGKSRDVGLSTLGGFVRRLSGRDYEANFTQKSYRLARMHLC